MSRIFLNCMISYNTLTKKRIYHEQYLYIQYDHHQRPFHAHPRKWSVLPIQSYKPRADRNPHGEVKP